MAHLITTLTDLADMSTHNHLTVIHLFFWSFIDAVIKESY